MRRAFVYKAKISKDTERNAQLWLRMCCNLYNACLEQRIDAYTRCRYSLGYFEQKRGLVALKTEIPEYKLIGSGVLQNVTDRIEKAYKAFFRRVKTGKAKAGFPRFHPSREYNSFTFPCKSGWKLDGKHLTIKNVGVFKLFLYRPIDGKIKTVTVKRDKLNRWWVSFSCDEVPQKPLQPVNKAVGIDVGLKQFLADSNGNTVDNPRFLEQSLKKLRIAQRSLSRKKKGSNRRNKARREVARIYNKVANQRKEFVIKTARDYVNDYDSIYVEDLKITNMLKDSRMAKSISDASWGMFQEKLTMAAEDAGRNLVKVNPKNTSQLCLCGAMVKKSLAVRTHKCPECGLEMDRDVLAAKNILERGHRSQALK